MASSYNDVIEKMFFFLCFSLIPLHKTVNESGHKDTKRKGSC